MNGDRAGRPIARPRCGGYTGGVQSLPPHPAPLVEAERLTKRFGDIVAVDSISFTVEAGSITALLGANGAGKTSTIAMLLGLLRPSSGTIRLFGEDIGTRRHAALGRMNFSSPFLDLPQRLTVRQNLVVYARLYAVPNPAQRVVEVAHDMDIDLLLDLPYRRLSVGQKTRVMLAKALLNMPELLLLDEPTASLDPVTAGWIRAYLRDYTRAGATILLASHNMQEVERLCDNVLLMSQGQIADRGSPAALRDKYGRDTMEDIFLDVVRAPPPISADP